MRRVCMCLACAATPRCCCWPTRLSSHLLPFRPPRHRFPVRNTQLRITFDAIDGVTDVKLSEVMSQGVLTEITVLKLQ